MIEVDGDEYRYAIAQWWDDGMKWHRIALLGVDEDADALLLHLETEYPSSTFELMEV